ncbi:MAG: hypothetical protein NC048_03265 [Bacteroides sp.]|nr:hypothetical protein [Bacteroides sp.]
MKPIYLFSILCVGFLTVACSNRETPPDYIESRYYTRVAEAQYAFIQENYRQAYEILSQLEKEIPLLNNVGTEYSEEIPLYIKLCLRFDEYGKAYRYMRLLVGEHGYPAHSFDAYFNIEHLKQEPYYDSLELLRLEAAFQPDTALYILLKEMGNRDYDVRISLPNNRDDLTEEDGIRMRRVDSINYALMREIISEKGFPLAQHQRFTLKQRRKVDENVVVMLMHFLDSNQMEYFIPLLEENVRRGDCPPTLLACHLESSGRMGPCFPYGMYMNLKKEWICDFEHLDDRRLSIGLPPHKLCCEIRHLQTMKDPNKDTSDFYTKIKMQECEF